MLSKALYQNLILVDGNGDGIFEIDNSQDQVQDLSGNSLTSSQAIALHSELDDRFYYVDSEGKWIGESQNQNQNPNAVAMGYVASPPSVTTSPKTHPGIKGGGALAVIGAAVLIGWKIFTNPDEEIEITPGVTVLPEREYFIIKASDEVDGDAVVEEVEIVVEESDDEIREEVEALMKEAQELNPEVFARAVRSFEKSLREPPRSVLGWSALIPDVANMHYFSNGRKEDETYARLLEMTARLAELAEAEELHIAANQYEVSEKIYINLGKDDDAKRVRERLQNLDPSGALRRHRAVSIGRDAAANAEPVDKVDAPEDAEEIVFDEAREAIAGLLQAALQATMENRFEEAGDLYWEVLQRFPGLHSTQRNRYFQEAARLYKLAKNPDKMVGVTLALINEQLDMFTQAGLREQVLPPSRLGMEEMARLYSSTGRHDLAIRIQREAHEMGVEIQIPERDLEQDWQTHFEFMSTESFRSLPEGVQLFLRDAVDLERNPDRATEIVRNILTNEYELMAFAGLDPVPGGDRVLLLVFDTMINVLEMAIGPEPAFELALQQARIFHSRGLEPLASANMGRALELLEKIPVQDRSGFQAQYDQAMQDLEFVSPSGPH